MSQDLAYARMDSPIGPLWTAATKTGLCSVGLGSGQPEAFFTWLKRHVGPGPTREDAEALAEALAQLRDYFSGTRRRFDLPLDVRGTAFQEMTWAAVAAIPYGETATYGEIARRIGHPGSARAVGGAVGANPLPIFIPCHRVVGAKGALTGYRGGLDVKAALLRLEMDNTRTGAKYAPQG